jgi:hypothetical protein
VTEAKPRVGSINSHGPDDSPYTIALHTSADGSRWHSCGECPMWCSEWGECQAPGAPQDDTTTSRNSDGSYPDGEAPDWCPLRKGPITIRLEER